MSYRVSDRALALDAAAIVIVSVAICVAADRLVFMTALVPTVLLARLALYARLPRGSGHLPFGVEVAFFAICIGLGAFNDWSSVTVKRIYDYGVPVFFDELTMIPLWMLLFWGMILRFITSLSWWDRLPARKAPSDRARLPFGDRTLVRVAALLLLVLVTRQAIYRFYLDPWLSWLPFAAAGLVYPVVFGLDKRDLVLVATFLLGGPLVEVAYIQLGGLHSYHLGWFFGVPLWIVIWWVLSVLVWKELSYRLIGALSRLDLRLRTPARSGG